MIIEFELRGLHASGRDLWIIKISQHRGELYGHFRITLTLRAPRRRRKLPVIFRAFTCDPV